MPRPLVGATISFGLVTIPVKLYRASQSLTPAFHLIHQACGTRIREQLFCPVHERVVSRDEVVRGYEIAKGRYVAFTPDELKALEATGSRTIDIRQFVPLRTIDPVYIEGTTFLGPDRGGDKPYRLLAEVLRTRDEVALGTYVMRGRESLVAIRAYQRGLVLHTLHFADEVRDFGEIQTGKGAIRREELQLALRLVETFRRPTFAPGDFEDTYRARVQTAARQKARGKAIRDEEPVEPTGTVVDLMEALRQSLKRKTRSAATRPAAPPSRKPAGTRRLKAS